MTTTEQQTILSRYMEGLLHYEEALTLAYLAEDPTTFAAIWNTLTPEQQKSLS